MALFDTCVVPDGHCKGPLLGGPRILWITPSSLSSALQRDESERPLLIDTRSFALYSVKHINTAQNLSFSPILVRRMLKGAISLDSLVTDPDLMSAIANAKQVVLYDSISKPANIRPELVKFSETLIARFGSSGFNLRILLGGMENFEASYPNLCTNKPIGKVSSPTKITLDTSVIERAERVQTPESIPVEILPYLFLGSAKDASNIEMLRKMGITAILNITTQCPNLFESEFEYMCIEVEDSHQADLLSKLQQAITFIDYTKSKGGRVFVHCHAGISRSATVCIAYMMQHHTMNVHEAYTYVKNRRPIISPNLHFMGQLMVYQQKLASVWATESRTPTKTTVTNVKPPIVSSCIVSMTKSVPPIHSTPNETHFPMQVSSSISAVEANLVSRLTDKLNHTSQTHPYVITRPPSFTNRSFSVPMEISNVQLQNRPRRTREGLRLSLNLTTSPSKRNSPQLSPCRVEAATLRDPLTQSLHLSSTCT